MDDFRALRRAIEENIGDPLNWYAMADWMEENSRHTELPVVIRLVGDRIAQVQGHDQFYQNLALVIHHSIANPWWVALYQAWQRRANPQNNVADHVIAGLGV